MRGVRGGGGGRLVVVHGRPLRRLGPPLHVVGGGVGAGADPTDGVGVQGPFVDDFLDSNLNTLRFDFTTRR